VAPHAVRAGCYRARLPPSPVLGATRTDFQVGECQAAAALRPHRAAPAGSARTTAPLQPECWATWPARGCMVH
jgi:hypothetical protein